MGNVPGKTGVSEVDPETITPQKEPMSRTIRLLMALPALAGCSGGGMGTEPILEELPRALSEAETRLIDGGNRFTFDLFREATRALPNDSNAFLSPLSASMALGMALNGAGGETFDSMRQTLRFGDLPLEQINQGYKSLTELLTGLDRSTEMLVANSVWLAQGFAMESEFQEAARTWFGAEAEALDFGSPAALSRINGWVAEATRNRIPKLLDQIRPEEVAFLVNALYFKGRWRVAFDPKQTQPQPFHAADGSTTNVPMMFLKEGVRYARTQSYEAAELLYGNGAFAMVIVLPAEGVTLAGLVAGMDAAGWSDLAGRLAENNVQLRLPRFKLEVTRELKDDLSGLGMGIAFDPNRADFYGIADVRPERLYLTRVLQKTFVEVNEEGTEAAAATAVGVGVTSAPPTMEVNRPFLFAIRERLSGTVVFMGQVNRLP